MFHVKHWEALLFYAAAERKRLSLSFLSGLEKPFPLSPFPFRDGGTIFVGLSLFRFSFPSRKNLTRRRKITLLSGEKNGLKYARILKAAAFKFCSPVPEREGGQGEGFGFAHTVKKFTKLPLQERRRVAIIGLPESR